MFLVGVLVQRHFARLSPWLIGKGAIWLALYCATVFASEPLGMLAGSNHPHPIPMTVLAFATISCAHSAPWLAERFLRGVDASYGVYIYHMAVVNAALALGGGGRWATVWISWGCTAALAVASWFAVERPALRRKKSPLHALSARD
jgi:peptidoglycan/LPS O-acetylase OafA/YrhL